MELKYRNRTDQQTLRAHYKQLEILSLMPIFLFEISHNGK